MTKEKEAGAGAQEEEEIVVVEEEPKAKPAKEQPEEDNDDAEDERKVKGADEEGSADEDPERAALRERRRKEKAERKARREAAMKRDNTELEFLRKRNDDLERRLTGLETQTVKKQASDIDAHMATAAKEFEMAEQVIAKATAAGNGDDVVKAMRYRDEARDKYNKLNQLKQNAAAQEQEQQRRPQQQPQQQPRLDPSVERYAQAFIRENEWYDPDGTDEDSAIVLTIDAKLAQEGYDPRTEGYWAELRKRAARRLPEKFQQREARGGPAVGNGRDQNAPTNGKREVYISPERKKALQEAGVWDDPILRAKYVKRYSEYDKAAKERS